LSKNEWKMLVYLLGVLGICFYIDIIIFELARLLLSFLTSGIVDSGLIHLLGLKLRSLRLIRGL